MATYNREWDRGKDTTGWSESPAYDPRHNVRPREDDYYNDGKRRKITNDAYDPYYQGDSYSYVPAQARQQEWPQEHMQDDRQRNVGVGGGSNFQPKRRLTPSEPSPHVIFLGLDPDFTEADLQAYLLSHGHTVETVTIIRERSSGTCNFSASKGFGFAQFASTELASAFVEPFFPFIQLPPPASHGASALAAFNQALETGAPHNGRRVKIDFSQSATPHDKRFNRANMNDGTRDIGNSQSAVLLFRGLDPISGPQAIHQAMLYSSGPGKQGAQGMRRIILIKERATMTSYGFAFVEFVDINSASAVLAATMSTQIHPTGFRISDRPVAASFAHPYSFQPVTDFLKRDDACLVGTPALGGVDGGWVRYWDETSTVGVLEFKVDEPVHSTPGFAPSKEKKEKKKPKGESEVPTASFAPTTLPLSNKPLLLSLNKGSAKATGVSGPSAVSALGFGDDGDEEEEIHEPSKPMAVKKVAPLAHSRKIVSNISKWNQVQEELSHPSTSTSTHPAPAPVVTPVVATLKPVVTASVSRSAEGTPTPEGEFEFSDVPALMCVLCSRKMKSIELLKRHNEESDLHKKNYQDANLREVARQKLANRKNVSSSSEAPKYRDRASERRTLFNQPDVPLPDKDVASSSSSKRKAEGPTRGPTPPLAVTPAPPPAKDETNVGNKLLKMMGWKEGTGLGSEGEGRIDPIETAVYAQGVGLGASKGRDISKYTEGFTNYAHATQESARDRFNP